MLVSLNSFAQDIVKPLSTNYNLLPKYTITQFNSETLLNRYFSNTYPEKTAVKFAEKHEHIIDIINEGSKTIINDKLVIAYRIQSRTAKNLNFGFTKYHLPQDAHLFIYNIEKTDIIGPFSTYDNDTHNQFWTPIVLGEDIIIELQLPNNNIENTDLVINYINHGFRNFGSMDGITERSGSCNVDVACPQADPYRDIIRSSAMFTINGTETCSGALINNTANDNRPYYLTANHCGISTSNAASVVAYWKYQNSVCRTPGSAASGQAGDGARNLYNSGAVLRAKWATTDFCLIEFDDPINTGYGLFWSGWNRANTPPNAATIIHHPNSEEMRITLSSSYSYKVSDYSGNNPGDSSHLQVTGYDIGTTEGGSSGCPIYDINKRIVGQLHGGPASCANNSGDFYGWFYKSWNGGGTSDTRLKDWLDPSNTGISYLNGLDALPLANLDVALQQVAGLPIATQTCNSSILPEVTFFNNGINTIQSLTINYTLDGITQQFIWNGNLTTYNSITVALPEINLSVGAHTFYVELQNPNGTSDVTGNNISGNYNFSVINGQNITINLLTDNYPSETTVRIFDASNNEVFSQSGFTERAYSYNIPVCLTAGCYSFIINDSQSDGICCAYGTGNIGVSSPQGVSYGNNANFNSQSWSLPFCVSSIDGIEENRAEKMILFPNPANDCLFIKKINTNEHWNNLEIYNIEGKKVLQSNNFSKEFIDISLLKNGIYLIKIYTENSIISDKLIVQRNTIQE